LNYSLHMMEDWWMRPITINWNVKRYDYKINATY
jgi:hypothetical protein